MPKRTQRDQATTQAMDLGSAEPEVVVLQCQQPVLVDLDIISGASYESAGRWWTVVHPTQPVQALATTQPNNDGAWSAITWAGAATAGGTAQLRNLARTAVGQHQVTALLNSPQKAVTIDIYDLVSVACDLPTHVGGLTWKGYAGHVPGDSTKLTATTNANLAPVWAHLVWQPAGQPGAQAHEQSYDVATAGDRKVSVVLGNVHTGTRTITATLHICQWPRLDVQAIEFDSLTVHNDGKAEIDKPFDKHWKSGRPDPAAGRKTADVQSVLCYAAGTKISVTPSFRVSTVPTETETVKVEGQATVAGVAMKWAGTVQVKPGDATVKLGKLVADKALPAGVGCDDAFTITWRMKDVDDATWLDAGKSVSPLYVTLAKPAVTPYWTLLDLSCRAAATKTTEDELVAASFVPFTTHTGDGNGMPRKGDGMQLSYYLDGVDTAPGGVKYKDQMYVYDTQGILSGPDGTGRCGGWADMLCHTWAIHGITGAKVKQLVVICRTPTLKHDGAKRFLVRNCSFSGAGMSTLAPFTHLGHTECVKGSGVAGQGKTNPQFDFSDHVACHYGGKIWDPSYGVGPVATQAEYENMAIAGLGSMAGGAFEFNMSDPAATPQFMAADCCSGYFEHKLKPGENLNQVATVYGKTGTDLWDHPFNRDIKKAGVIPPPAGTVIYIPREWDLTKTMLYGKLA
jgi:hypothetical protein